MCSQKKGTTNSPSIPDNTCFTSSNVSLLILANQVLATLLSCGEIGVGQLLEVMGNRWRAESKQLNDDSSTALSMIFSRYRQFDKRKPRFA
jgi:hypothetical protein